MVDSGLHLMNQIASRLHGTAKPTKIAGVLAPLVGDLQILLKSSSATLLEHAMYFPAHCYLSLCVSEELLSSVVEAKKLPSSFPLVVRIASNCVCLYCEVVRAAHYLLPFTGLSDQL